MCGGTSPMTEIRLGSEILSAMFQSPSSEQRMCSSSSSNSSIYKALAPSGLPSPAPGNSDSLGLGRVLANSIFKNSIDAFNVKY